MSQRIFVFDPGKCFGCFGCTAACANANDTLPGLLWRQVLKLPPNEGSHETVYLSVSCNHCAEAPCVKACPSEALKKREDDGVVIHDPELCIGCQYCRMACPYDAIRWEGSRGVVSKCNFCHERLEEEREPACVETCFAGALKQRIVEVGEEAGDLTKESPGLIHLEDVGPNIRFVLKGGKGK